MAAALSAKSTRSLGKKEAGWKKSMLKYSKIYVEYALCTLR